MEHTATFVEIPMENLYQSLIDISEDKQQDQYLEKLLVPNQLNWTDFVGNLDTYGWGSYFEKKLKGIRWENHPDWLAYLCFPFIFMAVIIGTLVLVPILNTVSNVLTHYKTMLYHTGLYLLLIISIKDNLPNIRIIKYTILILYLWLIIGVFDSYYHMFQLSKVIKRECGKKTLNLLRYFEKDESGKYHVYVSEGINCLHIRLGLIKKDNETDVGSYKIKKEATNDALKFRVSTWGYKLWFADYRSGRIEGNRVFNDFYDTKWGDCEYLYHHFNGVAQRMDAIHAFKLYLSKRYNYDLFEIRKADDMTHKFWAQIQTWYIDWCRYIKVCHPRIHYYEKYALTEADKLELKSIFDFLQTNLIVLTKPKEDIMDVIVEEEVEVVKQVEVISYRDAPLHYPRELIDFCLTDQYVSIRQNVLKEMIMDMGGKKHGSALKQIRQIRNAVKMYDETDPDWREKGYVTIQESEMKEVVVKEKVEVVKQVVTTVKAGTLYREVKLEQPENVLRHKFASSLASPDDKLKKRYLSAVKARGKIKRKIIASRKHPNYPIELYEKHQAILKKRNEELKKMDDLVKERFKSNMVQQPFRYDLINSKNCILWILYSAALKCIHTSRSLWRCLENGFALSGRRFRAPTKDVRKICYLTSRWLKDN